MKTVNIDIEQIVKDKLKNEIFEPAIKITVIHGLNYDNFGVLTKAPNGTYFWSDIHAPYSSVRVMKSESWDDEWLALRDALMDNKKIFQFENIKEFGEWLAKPNKEKGLY